MKKIMLFLLCLLLVGALAACTQAQVTTGEQPSTAAPAPSTSTGATETTVPTTTAVELEPPAPLSDEALIEALTEYIKMINAECEMPDGTLYYWLLRAKSDSDNAYFAVTDEDAYYYMCAYYTSDEDDFNFPNVDNYTWVKFSSEAEITEYYDELTFMIGFQINGTQQSRCLDTGADATMEYCQRYKPVFADGFNTTASLACDESLVYLTSSQTPIYYINDWHSHSFWARSCIERDEQFYLLQLTSSTRPGVYSSSVDLSIMFGDYYDILMDVMITGEYSATTEKGIVCEYGLIPLEVIEQIIRN